MRGEKGISNGKRIAQKKSNGVGAAVALCLPLGTIWDVRREVGEPLHSGAGK